MGVAFGSGCWTTLADPPAGEPDTVWLVTQILEPTGAQPTYVHNEDELVEGVAAGRLALILAPVPIPMVVDTALNGRVMPPKSTLFWPKPRTGMLLRDLNQPD
ncbi:MAG: hypothetical protein NVSMB32_18510 [Actinomycetota bacterium]